MKIDTSTDPRRTAENISDGIIHTVTNDTFGPLVINGDGPIVVEFMSYGCMYCRAIEPVLKKVAARLKSTERFFRVNIAADQELADRYEIHGTPTLIMFLNGQEAGRVEGAPPEVESLLSAVTKPFDLRN